MGGMEKIGKNSLKSKFHMGEGVATVLRYISRLDLNQAPNRKHGRGHRMMHGRGHYTVRWRDWRRAGINSY